MSQTEKEKQPLATKYLSPLLKKFLMENFIFCAVVLPEVNLSVMFN